MNSPKNASHYDAQDHHDVDGSVVAERALKRQQCSALQAQIPRARHKAHYGITRRKPLPVTDA